MGHLYSWITRALELVDTTQLPETRNLHVFAKQKRPFKKNSYQPMLVQKCSCFIYSRNAFSGSNVLLEHCANCAVYHPKLASDTNKLRSFKEVPPGTLNRTLGQQRWKNLCLWTSLDVFFVCWKLEDTDTWDGMREAIGLQSGNEPFFRHQLETFNESSKVLHVLARNNIRQPEIHCLSL